MKVILLKDVPRIGRKYEVKDVPDGHALNMLLPRKLAERATPDALRRLEAQKSKHAVEVAESDKAFMAALAKAKDAGATVAAEANEEGHLYRAIHADDIVKAFSEKGIEIDERSVVIEAPIKHIGTHTVKLATGGREGDVSFEVIRA
jgi:large subunit ribosomal protein L9